MLTWCDNLPADRIILLPPAIFTYIIYGWHDPSMAWEDVVARGVIWQLEALKLPMKWVKGTEHNQTDCDDTSALQTMAASALPTSRDAAKSLDEERSSARPKVLLDLTNQKFSPHWSASTNNVLTTPSPIKKLKDSRDNSPQRWPSPIGEYKQTGQNFQTPPKIRIKKELETLIANNARLVQHKVDTSFSPRIAPALLNMNVFRTPNIGLTENTSPQSAANNLVASSDGRRHLISQLKATIADLERLEEENTGEFNRDRNFIPSIPPRSSVIPRSRDSPPRSPQFLHQRSPVRTSPLRHVSSFTDSALDFSETPTKKANKSSSDGLYGAESVDQSYWQGFDEEYQVGDRSFDTLSSEEEVHDWKTGTSKWLEKGVTVLKPLSEASRENSASGSVGEPSPASVKSNGSGKKEVHWADRVTPQ